MKITGAAADYMSITNKLRRKFWKLLGNFSFNRPISLPQKGNIVSENFFFTEVRSDDKKAFFRVFDPMDKKPIVKERIVIEFCNQALNPSYFRGEVAQKAFDIPEFMNFIETILNKKEKTCSWSFIGILLKKKYEKENISKLITKFSEKVYEIK